MEALCWRRCFLHQRTFYFSVEDAAVLAWELFFTALFETGQSCV